MLSFPCPVQKIQDLTLPSIVSSLNLDREKKFSYGQLYVALKRMKLLRNLCIKGQVTKEALSLDPDGGIEYCRLKTQCCLTTWQIAVGISIALLNMWSLLTHIRNIASDSFIWNVSIIFLTETQVFHNQEPNMRFENLQLVIRNDPTDCFNSLSFSK